MDAFVHQGPCRGPVPRSGLLNSLLLWALLLLAGCQPIQAPAPGPIEPLVPTPVSDVAPASPSPDEVAGLEIPAAPPPPLPAPYTLRWRVGVGVPDGETPLLYRWPASRPGWYLNWSIGFTETQPLVGSAMPEIHFRIPLDEAVGMEFVPMVRTPEGQLWPDEPWIRAVAERLPGRTWLIGNEPDVRWQDNATPEAYARAYHRAYTAIKAADPTAQVAIGGISQVTPLRLAYLERIWEAYQTFYGDEMPVDVWTMHGFVLQEKAGDWGVDIPPGFDHVTDGVAWGIQDHDDLSLVEGQVLAMRRWMREHGQQQKPLWVTEYGILMPAEYGFSPEVVRRFLLGSFDLFRQLRDPELGYPVDEDRLVQRWVWFSTGYDLYPTGDLFTRSGQPTGLMLALAAYLEEFAGP